MDTPNVRGVSLDFWEGRWKDGTPSWHRGEVDAILQIYRSLLTKDKASIKILVTFCGKSVDLPWLCEQGHTVVGAELSEIAVQQLFEENKIPYPVSTDVPGFKVFTANDRKLKLYTGDFYNLTPDITGEFDAIWDHRAQGAVSPDDRLQYIEKLRSLLTPEGRILLSNFEYDQTKHDIAPYSLPLSLVKELFGDHFEVGLLERQSPDDYQLLQLSIQKFKLGWAYRPIHLLSRKS